MKNPFIRLQLGYILFAFLVLLGCNGESDPQQEWAKSFDQHQSWQLYGGGPDQSKYVKTDLIDKSNVDQLEVAWFYSTSDNNTYHFNPTIVDSVMYIAAHNHSLVALNANTGEEIWIHTDLRGMTRRGVNYWESDDGVDKRLIFARNNYLQVIDAETGESILDFGEDGAVDLKQNLDRDPETLTRAQSGMPGQIFENLIILGSSTGENYMATPGHVRAYDVITGELEWKFRTIPHPGEYGYETWPEDAYKYAGGANVWGEISIDVERGIAFLPTASPKYNYYGADRIGQNLFGNSLIAVDARTGERIWHYQIVHHDLFDYDLNTAPQLMTIQKDGEEIDIVAQATKQGFLYVFDRETGEPVYEIEEKPVPQSDVPGEESWPTQPHPVELPPFSRQSLTSDDVSPYLLTDAEREEWKEELDRLNELGRVGPFIPLSTEHPTVSIPGAVGGANWGSSASNPEEGIFYVISMVWPSFYEPLEKRTPPDPDEVVEESLPFHPVARGGILYEQHCQVCHGEDHRGLGTAPSLLNIGESMNFADFEHVTTSGLGEMPAFGFLDEDEVMSIYRYLGGSADGDIIEGPDGPVVASGGASGAIPRNTQVEGSRTSFGIPYPDDVDTPDVRYYSQGYGLGQPYVAEPPWSKITAYDLNEGIIKWQKPLGEDKIVEAEGGENSGMLRAQRHGMIVTSTGLLFSTSRDGRIYAFDAETGDELWYAELPTGTEGLPSFYEIDGQIYIVVTATTPLRWGREDAPDDPPQGGYVVFTLNQD